MTRKHYQALGAALKWSKPTFGLAPLDKASNKARLQASQAQWAQDVREVADALAADNSRFDRSRFFAACGLDSDR